MTLPINFSPCGTVARFGRYGRRPRVLAAGRAGRQRGVTGGTGALFLQGKRHPHGLRSPGSAWLTDHLSDTPLPLAPAEPSGTPAPTRLRFSPGSGVTGRLG